MEDKKFNLNLDQQKFAGYENMVFLEGPKTKEIAEKFVEVIGDNPGLIAVLQIYATGNITSRSKGRVKIGERIMTLGDVFNAFKGELVIGDKRIALTIPKMYKFFLIGKGSFLKLRHKTRKAASGNEVRYQFLDPNQDQKERVIQFNREVLYAYEKDLENYQNNTEGANIMLRKILFMGKGNRFEATNEMKEKKMFKIFAEAKNFKDARRMKSESKK